jgi:hypothetical protein
VDANLVLDRQEQFRAVIPKSQWHNLAAAIDLNAAWNAPHDGIWNWDCYPLCGTTVSLGRMIDAYVEYATPVSTTLGFRCLAEFV